MLNDQDKCLVKTAKFNRIFCFGDGVEVKGINSVEFPVTIEGVKGVRASIEADIVKNDPPLLLSHKSMKTAGMLLNFKKWQQLDFSQIYKITKYDVWTL